MKKLLALIALVAVLGISGIAAAQPDDSDVTTTAEVSGDYSFDVVCWANHTTAPTRTASASSSVSVIQPGITLDPYDVYDTVGTTANGALEIADGGAFGYGDCRYWLDTNNTNWNLTYDGTTFVSASFSLDDTDEVNLDNQETTAVEATVTIDYPADDEEVGFVIPTATFVAATVATAFDDMTGCGTNTAFPCYQAVNLAASADAIVGGSAAETDGEFDIRTGVGVDSNTESATYTMTTTMTYAEL
jgi:hypothetical protein